MADDELLEDLFSWRGDSQSQPQSQPQSQGRRGLSQMPSTSTNVLMAATTTTTSSTTLPCAATTSTSSNINDNTITNNANSTEAKTSPPLEIPSALKDRLFPHQVEGIDWLYRKHCKARACLLADEMGLGKTVQVCAFLGLLYKAKQAKTTIIVVPPTLLPMWESSLAAWGELELGKVVETVHQDSKAKRTSRWKKLNYGLPCVMVTTYGVLRQDVTAMSTTLVDYVILDEAHLIKDASTHAFKSALTLSARHKIALTGTPLMNSFEDMWSIFRFLDGSIINMKRSDFSSISSVLLRGNERDANGHNRVEAEAELNKLQTAIRPFMLRREKKDLGAVVSSQKHDSVVWVKLSQTQRNLYDSFLSTKEVTAHTGVENAAAATTTTAATNPLLLLTTLQQICNHPWLSLTETAFLDAVKRPLEAPCEDVGDMLSGSKLPTALAIIRKCIAEKRKSLVFSRSKRLLAMLAKLLAEANISYVRIDGDMHSSEDRFQAVRDFGSRQDVSVCLMTTQVGGVGLTFDSASCVILMDPSWNPSADAQAVDRVHRIGQQESNVLVFRLVTCGTVEEKVYRNQVFKTMAAKQSMQAEGSGPDTFFRYFTRLQLRSMFDVGDLDASETAQQLELLHPNRVRPEAQAMISGIDTVSAISDNGSVLVEAVASEAAAELLPRAEEETHRGVRRGLDKPSLGSAAPKKRHRVEDASLSLSAEEVSDLLGVVLGADDSFTADITAEPVVVAAAAAQTVMDDPVPMLEEPRTADHGADSCSDRASSVMSCVSAGSSCE